MKRSRDEEMKRRRDTVYQDMDIRTSGYQVN